MGAVVRPAASYGSRGALRRCGGFHKAACGAREEYSRLAGSDSTSGTRSERARGRERSFGESPASQGPREPAHAAEDEKF